MSLLSGTWDRARAQSPPEPGQAREQPHSIRVGGLARRFYLYAPDRAAAYPLLVVLHGAGGRALGFARHTGFTRLAEREGFAVAYPQGIDRRWDDGRGLVRSRDDVGFIRAMLDSIRAEHPIDSTRIYAAGISNGAIMTHRLACDLPGVFAAIAAVAGAFPAALESRCADSARVSLVAFQGMADPMMPYGGGGVGPGGLRGVVLSARATAERWARRDGCESPPIHTTLPDQITDGTRVTRDLWNGCPEGQSVALYSVQGGGHTWPGGPPSGPLVGRTTREIDATRVIWEFFERHPKLR